MTFWDTIEPSSTATLGSHRFTADEIVRFATKYDPQPFHLDEAAAQASLFGGLCASGWHTCAVMMRLIVEDQKRRVEAWTGAGNAMPLLGPSPGARNLRWTRPVFVGDVVTYRQTITGKRASASRAGWGVVEMHVEATNQDDATVFSMDGAVLTGTD